MEQPPNNHKKKTSKTMPLAINIPTGSFGIGGIVLFGGALVTATLVSALALKTRKQHRSSSKDTNKIPSPAPAKNIQNLSGEQELLMMADKENSEHVDIKSFSNEVIEVGVEAAAQDQVPVGHDVAEEKETVIMNKDEHHSSVVSGMNMNDRLKVSVDDQTVLKEENPPTQLMNKEDKHTEKIVTEDELVKKDEIPLVQSIEEDEGGEKDVTLKNEVTECMQEEPTPEAKISNQKTQENIEENHTKSPNIGDIIGSIKEDKCSRDTWSVLISIWYLVGSLVFILILLWYQNRTI